MESRVLTFMSGNDCLASGDEIHVDLTRSTIVTLSLTFDNVAGWGCLAEF